MKLVETKLNSNLDIEKQFPNIAKAVFDRTTIKTLKLYSLNKTVVINADLYDKKLVLLINEVQKISKSELDFVIDKMFQPSEKFEITLGVKEKILEKGHTLSRPIADIILIKTKKEEKALILFFPVI